MSVEHMAMVFAAEGLDGSEKLLLLAYTNYTDPHGYCYPGEERLAEDTGTSVSTVRRTKKKLIAKNLVKSERRAETSNLARVNLPLLASMRRAPKAYDDNEIDRLSFDTPKAAETGSGLRTVQSDLSPSQGSDQQTEHSDLWSRSECSDSRVNLTCPTGQSDLQSISDPSGETTTSPRPPVRLVSESAPTDGGGGGGDAPQQEATDQTAAAFVDRLPYLGKGPDRQQRRRLIAGVAAALAGGWSEVALRVELTEDTASAKSLTAVYLHRLKPEVLPDAPALPAPRTGEQEPPRMQRAQCPECHRPLRNSTEDALCSDCREDATA